jgi:hypothetical protein
MSACISVWLQMLLYDNKTHFQQTVFIFRPFDHSRNYTIFLWTCNSVRHELRAIVAFGKSHT